MIPTEAQSGFAATILNPSDSSLIQEQPIKLLHCPRCDGLFFININTGEKIDARCNAYKCDYCGPRKAFKLETAMERYFSTYRHIRLLTATVRTTLFDLPGHSIRDISECWRRFITSVRRSKSLSDSQRQFSYVKVLEFTKRGYPHFHVVVNSFLPWTVLQHLWEESICQVFGVTGRHGTINLEHLPNPRSASKYVTKYVLKAAKQNREHFRLWSRSKGVALFEVKISTHEWKFSNERRSLKVNPNSSSASELNLLEFCITSQFRAKLLDIMIDKFDFDNSIPPEECQKTLNNNSPPVFKLHIDNYLEKGYDEPF
jgi:hypothetical protein